jgi:hypothetical protein
VVYTVEPFIFTHSSKYLLAVFPMRVVTATVAIAPTAYSAMVADPTPVLPTLASIATLPAAPMPVYANVPGSIPDQLATIYSTNGILVKPRL